VYRKAVARTGPPVDHGAVLRNAAMRSGLGALGAIYFALGAITWRVALGARRSEQGIPAALRLLLDQPHGALILGALVTALGAIAVIHVVEAFTRRLGLVARIGMFVNGIGYAALAWTAGRLLLHLDRSGSVPKAGVSWLLGESWGPTVVEVIGGAVIAGGLWELYQGVAVPLPFRRDLLPRHLGRALAGIARFGLVVRGLVLAVLGSFLIRAAEELDPGKVRTMGGTLRALSHTGLGPLFTAAVAVGLVAYGVYMWTLMLLKRRV
jgi:Domain of Unknown Function (DUF1206)